MSHRLQTIVGITLLAWVIVSCGHDDDTAPNTALAKELVFYDWEADIPQAVLDTFTAEYGVSVSYPTYASSEEAVQSLKDGQVYDVVVMENRFIQTLTDDHLLAAIDFSQVPNFKNVFASFRDLAYDPGNKYSVPFNWGTTALVVRSDLLAAPVTRWADLWDPRYRGQIGVWGVPREAISFTLKSLGYSANSEDPAELEQARVRLVELAPYVRFLEEFDEVTSAPALLSGEIIIAHGYAYDAVEGRAQNEAITYVIPEEGALMWGDNFVIPANSPRQYTAEVFINFMLRPEIAAQIANENYYATSNEAAMPLIDPELVNDPAVFPSNAELANAELLLPLSPEAEALYEDIWNEFIEAVNAE